MKGQLIIGEMLAMPWALKRDVLQGHVAVIASWLAGRGGNFAMEDDDGRPTISAFEARRQQANARVGGSGISVIPVYGTIVQRAGMMTEWCGGSSTQQLSNALADAMADDTVGQILLEFDTPGGSVYGVQELADQIQNAKKTKPVVGVANSLSASAGYWLMSQCSECYVAPGGEVGSIGVWQAHEDWSKAMEDAGIATTLISAGKFKVEGNPYQPLDDDAKAFLQSRVDEYYTDFTKAVARGRGVPIDSVRGGMGQGRVLGADQALAEKMVDGVATRDMVIKNMQKNMRAGRTGAGASRELDRARSSLLLV